MAWARDIVVLFRVLQGKGHEKRVLVLARPALIGTMLNGA
jgi:hypothetical protein